MVDMDNNILPSTVATNGVTMHAYDDECEAFNDEFERIGKSGSMWSTVKFHMKELLRRDCVNVSMALITLVATVVLMIYGANGNSGNEPSAGSRLSKDDSITFQGTQYIYDCQGNKLSNEISLQAGQYLCSENGKFVFGFSETGHIVKRSELAGESQLLSQNIVGESLVLHKDGDIAVYSDKKEIWKLECLREVHPSSGCLPNYDCPYMYILDDGKIYLKWMNERQEWDEVDIMVAYQWDIAYKSSPSSPHVDNTNMVSEEQTPLQKKTSLPLSYMDLEDVESVEDGNIPSHKPSRQPMVASGFEINTLKVQKTVRLPPTHMPTEHPTIQNLSSSSNSSECLFEKFQYGVRLPQGKYLCAKNGNYKFGLKTNGDFVYMDKILNETFLLNPSDDSKGYQFMMQRDAKLVIYNTVNEIVWSRTSAAVVSKTVQCQPPYDCPYISLHNDGVVVLNWVNNEEWYAKNIRHQYNFGEFSHP